MASYSHQSNGAGIPPRITLYTNHGCPWAHRAHIALKELDLPFDEVIIDLDTPREPWYLKINPRGLVPALRLSNDVLPPNTTITESAIVSQFLADLRPSHLLPASLADPYAPLVRARIAFFVDAWMSKVQGFLYPVLFMGEGEEEREEREGKCKEWVGVVEKEIEGLLGGYRREGLGGEEGGGGKGPFLGGRERMTLAEVMIAPFLLRMYVLSEHGVLPRSLKQGLQKLPNFSAWADAVLKQESVLYIFDEKSVVERTVKRLEKMRAEKKG